MHTKLPAVPLITCDPYFSLWSFSDTLNGSDISHWTGKSKRITGDVWTDGRPQRFMGAGESPMKQTALDITPTSSLYTFENEQIRLQVRFTTPLILTDLDLASRPVSYLDFQAESLDGNPHDVRISASFDEGICYNGDARHAFMGGTHELGRCRASWMGRRQQPVLQHSGDDLTIDWGYLYAAVSDSCGKTDFVQGDRNCLTAEFHWDSVGSAGQSACLTVGYDDLYSINYYGDFCKGYWARGGKSILEVLSQAAAEHDRILALCEVFDADLVRTAEEIGGEDYAKICVASYRQSIAAHKLIADPQGNPVFISKECFSNGCAATVDVSYPSIPLYLLYNPELVLGMMRPILQFARTPAWPFDFAPHDAGRFPQLCGNVYGLGEKEKENRPGEGELFPPYYQFPASADIYGVKDQMPVEECGNLLLMAAAALCRTDCTDFIRENMDLFTGWVGYLVRYGADPGEQLCTDDFAGHLAHNVNLAAKAIMGVEAYSRLAAAVGLADEAGWYHQKAACMAKDWVKNSDRGDHSALVFDKPEGWSLKYNLVWDKVFGSRLFPEELYRQEADWYCTQINAFGVPLDSRADYTKSDWTVWAASLAPDKETRLRLLAPIAGFLSESPDRVPFSDWYDTKTGKVVGFRARSVQGGVFMPLLLHCFE